MEPTEVRWLGIKPHVFRTFSGFMLLWSVNQVVYALMAWTTPLPPSAFGLTLLFPAQEPGYLASLVMHSLGVLVYGTGTVIPSRTLMRVEEWWEVHRERPTWVAGLYLYLGFALVILVSFWLFITEPRYQTYANPESLNIVRRHTHLLRPGVVHETIPFSSIREIVFDIDPSVGGQDSYLKLVLGGGREVEVGRTTVDYPEERLVELGRSISRYSSVPFEEPSLAWP